MTKEEIRKAPLGALTIRLAPEEFDEVADLMGKERGRKVLFCDRGEMQIDRSIWLRFSRGPALAMLMLFAVIASTAASCPGPPPNLSPEASLAFTNTRVIKGLDVLRNAAIDAEAAVPQQLSTATTRKVVLFHQSALRTIEATGHGWRPVVAAALAQLPQNLPTKERAVLEPYLSLVSMLLSEVN